MGNKSVVKIKNKEDTGYIDSSKYEKVFSLTIESYIDEEGLSRYTEGDIIFSILKHFQNDEVISLEIRKSNLELDTGIDLIKTGFLNFEVDKNLFTEVCKEWLEHVQKEKNKENN